MVARRTNENRFEDVGRLGKTNHVTKYRQIARVQHFRTIDGFPVEMAGVDVAPRQVSNSEGT